MGSYKTNCIWGSRGFSVDKKTPAASQKRQGQVKSSIYDKALSGVQQFTDNIDEGLLRVLAKNYSITQANPDSANVACGDSSEVNTVVKSFAVKKLGMEVDAAAEAVKNVCADMASSRQKNRIVFYYLLTKKVGRESVFV